MQTPIPFKRLIHGSLLAAILLPLAACSSNPSMAPDFARVETLVNEAEEARADRFAGREFVAAKDKLAQAKKANEREKFDRAQRLVDEASLHAQLAEAQARNHQAEKSLQELNGSLQSLQREINRKSSVH